MSKIFTVLLIVGVVATVIMCLYGAGLVGTENSRADREQFVDTDDKTEKPNVPSLDRTSEGLLQIVGMQNAHFNIIKSLAKEFAEKAAPRITQVSTGYDGSLVPNIVYINMASSTTRDTLMKEEVKKFGGANVFRFEGIPVKNNGAKGCYLSHLHVLAWASQQINDHVLILEDDFTLDVDYDELASHIREAEAFRWDVLVLGQYVHDWQPLTDRVFRTFHSTTTSGYLVHRDYLLELFTKWHQSFLPIQTKTKFSPQDNLDQIQTKFQKVDVWLAFRTSMGSQRPGTSTIDDVDANNKWVCSDDLTTWTDSKNKTYPLKTRPKLVQKRVAVCLVATGKYHQFLQRVSESCYKKFVKPHPIEFFVFTDRVDSVPDAYFGCSVHKYFVERKGFPGDTLYRYHYMLKAEQQLLQMDNIYYMDVDYWVCNPTETEKILVDQGLVAVKHLHNLHPTNERIKGTPELNPASTACIPADKSMQFYFCGGFQGGASREYLAAMREIKKNIDTDDSNKVMAVWHDESHWNRYLVDYPPAVILSQSYVYDEACLNPENQGDTATQLRTQNIPPRMVALSKSHAEFHVAA